MIRQLVTVPLFTPMGLMDKNRTVAGVNLGHLWDDPFLPVAMNRLLILYREGQIKPHIDSSFPPSARESSGSWAVRAPRGHGFLVTRNFIVKYLRGVIESPFFVVPAHLCYAKNIHYSCVRLRAN